MARPKKDPNELRDAFVRLRFSESEKAKLTEFARSKGQALAVWARTQLIGAMEAPEAESKRDEPQDGNDAFCMIVPVGGERVEVRLRSVTPA